MSQRQRFVLGVVAAAFVLAVMFYVPWRVEPSDKVKWAPIYRQPVSYVRSYEDGRDISRFVYEDGEVAFDIFVLEVLVIGAAGRAAFLLASD